MLFLKTVDIADNERALLFDRDRLQKVLTPGRHRLGTLGRKLRIETFDITSVKFEHPKLKFMLKQYPQLLEDVLDVFEPNDRQVGIIYRDGKIADILPPGNLLATWKGSEDVRVDAVDISEQYQIDDELTS